MRKIISFFIILISVFTINKVYALDEINNNITVNIDNYSVVITKNSNKTITIEETIQTKNLNDNNLFIKEFNNNVTSVKSNFIELPSESQSLIITDKESRYHEFYLSDDTTYYLNYTIDISNPNLYYSYDSRDSYPAMFFSYSPVYSSIGKTNYNNYSFRLINFDEDVIQEIKQNKSDYYNIEIKDKYISGYGYNIESHNEKGKNYISDIFLYLKKENSPLAIEVFGVRTNYIFISISLFMFLCISYYSFIKIKTKNQEINKKLINMTRINSIITIIMMASCIYMFRLDIFLIRLIFLSFIYFMYWKAFSDSFYINRRITPTETFTILFTIIHCYFLVYIFSLIEQNNDITFINIHLILLLLSTVISIFTYRIKSDDLTIENVSSISDISSIRAEDLINKFYKKIHFKEYKQYENFKDYSKVFIEDNKFNLQLKITYSIVAILIFVFQFIPLLEILKIEEIIKLILIIIFILLTTLYIIKQITKYKNYIKLINEGEIIRDLPFEYINLNADEESSYKNYKMLVRHNYCGKNIFISNRKKDITFYNIKTCSMIILKDNPDIYYIDYDIPNR